MAGDRSRPGGRTQYDSSKSYIGTFRTSSFDQIKSKFKSHWIVSTNTGHQNKTKITTMTITTASIRSIPTTDDMLKVEVLDRSRRRLRRRHDDHHRVHHRGSQSSCFFTIIAVVTVICLTRSDGSIKVNGLGRYCANALSSSSSLTSLSGGLVPTSRIIRRYEQLIQPQNRPDRRRRRRTSYNDKGNKPSITTTVPMATTTTSLYSVAAIASPAATKTLVTGLALALSAIGGMKCQQRWPSTGIVGSLVTAGCLSTVFNQLIAARTSSSISSLLHIPTVHPLYDMCFQLFLPASLTLLLLAYRPPPPQPSSSTASSNSSIQTSKTSTNLITTCIRRTALPFVVASVASWIGCWTSYEVSTRCNWFSFMNGGTGSGTMWSLLMPMNGIVRPGVVSRIVNEECARNAASVLTASYIGGSVNAMATSRILQTPADLLGSLVTADLITMSFYFSFLDASLNWNGVLSPRRFLEGRRSHQRPKLKSSTTTRQEVDDTESTKKPTSSSSSSSSSGTEITAPRKRTLNRLLVSIPLLVGTYGLVSTANGFEKFVSNRIGIPGTSCAVLAIVAPTINSWMQKYLNGGGINTKISNNNEKSGDALFDMITDVANPLSDFFFLTFFASLGLSVDLSSALMSFGPSCLAFSTLALTIHVVLTLLGCWPIARLSSFISSNRRGRPKNNDVEFNDNIDGVGLEEAWIASNAAIGGPATAAAYVMNCMKGRSVRDDRLLQGRTIAATVWGVVGYAVGTVLGVAMYNWTGRK